MYVCMYVRMCVYTPCSKKRKNERTNEVYLPMNRVNSDRLPVKAEAHQSWPPKKTKKRQSNDTKTTEKKEKYIVMHKITPNSWL